VFIFINMNEIEILIENIKKLYLEEDLAYRKVCKILGISKGRFERLAKKYNIKKVKEYRSKLKSTISKEELEDLYVNKKLDSIQISKLPIAKGYSKGKILELIHLYNIKRPKDWYTPSQLAIPKETRNLLECKERLENFIKVQDKPVAVGALSKKLHISASYLRTYLNKYSLWNYITPSASKYEVEIKETFSNLGIELAKNKKILGSGKEIDLYNEQHKLGVEFNGNHWHRIDNKGRNYHQNKSLLAIEKGVFLYHIFEYDWKSPYKKTKIINQLKNLFGLNEYKVFARKCKIKEVVSKEAKDFLDQNHLQGADKALVRLGLYFNNELVAIMTFCKPRFNKKFEWELSRFCCKANTSVVGGASKLFQYFIKNYNPENIISYSDIAHTKGSLYEKLGFEYRSISHPNYVWVKDEEVLTRYQCQKSKLIKQFPEYKDLTENEIMTKLGYIKIEDAGNILWVFRR